METLNYKNGSTPVVEAPSPAESREWKDEIYFSELLSACRRRKGFIIRVVLVTVAVASVIALIIPVKYAAQAVILTPQQAQSSLVSMAQMAGVTSGGLSGLSLLSGFGLRNPSDLYIGILQSRTIADGIINRFDLKRVYGDRDFFAARKHLAQNTTISAGKDSLIHIRVEDRDPQRSANLANAYVEELALQNSTVALTEASQRRLFFEGQLVKEKDALANAEIALRDTQQATGLVVPTGQAEAIIRSVSQLRAEILSREAQVEAMKLYVADDNPKFQVIKRELGTLRAELARLEKGNHVPGTPEVPTGQLPQAGLEYLRKFREVKYHETLFEVLSKQYEAARLDEAKAAPLVQIIDKAVVPERRSWPPRTLLVCIAAVFSAIVSICWVILGNCQERHISFQR
ncbi:MAG: lipopolysaccharide biosynthesis protein [Acidobacteriaceae bacterium]|nr:lipopolysaccharide biosynthesis protein [Acidobacteriaceae bacterium]